MTKILGKHKPDFFPKASSHKIFHNCLFWSLLLDLPDELIGTKYIEQSLQPSFNMALRTIQTAIQMVQMSQN